MVVGLRHDSDLVLRPGMVFHLLSWLIGTSRGDHFLSNTALLTDQGCEILTKAPGAPRSCDTNSRGRTCCSPGILFLARQSATS
jgi:hypothetical protein